MYLMQYGLLQYVQHMRLPHIAYQKFFKVKSTLDKYIFNILFLQYLNL